MATQIVGLADVRVFGRTVWPRPDDGAPGRARLVGTIARALYGACYVTGTPAPGCWDGVSASRILSRGHVAELEAARTNTLTLREGLPLYGIDGDVATFGVLGLRVTAPVSALVTDEPLEPGATVGVWMPNERRASSPGFWSLFGRVHPPDRDDSDLVRVYWNLCAEGAPHLVRALGSGLDDAGVGYRLKLLSAPHHYQERTDTAVLYLERDDWDVGAGAIVAAQHAVADWFEAETPMFTRRLAPGLATADDPGGTVSFGQHRCALVAEGLVRAWEIGRLSLRDRVAAIEEAFSDADIDPTRPHLQPGHVDLSELPIPARRAARRPSEQPLQVAHALCRRIADEAVWHEDRCGWLAPMILANPDGGLEQGWGSLNADLYDGSAGVALALAEVATACDDDALAKVAAGALRAALHRADELKGPYALGLFSGLSGLALAATRVGRLLGDSTLGVAARALSAQAEPSGESDLVGGLAGAIVVELALSGHRHRATNLGEILLARAEMGASGRSWPSPEIPRAANLAGLSHGAAGIGLALAELAGATHDERFRAAALDAFAYERSLFDRDLRNWPTLIRGDGPPGTPPSFQATWCHGAAGIALSRLRAWELLGEEFLRQEAIVALRTTERVTRAWLRSGRWNFTLCHGLSGNAEILRLGGDLHPAGVALADLVMRTGAQRIEARGRPWPCGVPDGEPPSLMNGLAGIAHAYLRMHDRAVPSVLLPRAGSFAVR